jgi:uncharacterized protein YraI
MRKIAIQFSLFALFVALIILGVLVNPANAGQSAQQPTVDIPTVTGTSLGPTITVNADNDQINVRSGPGTDYEKVGILISGQTLSALGKSAAGLWILIVYPGVEGGTAWVYSPLVTVSDGNSLPIVAPPPTAAPLFTATIDPTLAAQFQLDQIPTRLPTFTAPPPLVIPTYSNENVSTGLSGLPPMGLFIVLFGVIGIIGTIVTFTQRR